MSDRKRLVHGKQFDYFVCDVHDWEFDESTTDDVCPVCRGEQMERERIIKLIEANHSEYAHTSYEYHERFCMSCGAIALIKGENSE